MHLCCLYVHFKRILRGVTRGQMTDKKWGTDKKSAMVDYSGWLTSYQRNGEKGRFTGHHGEISDEFLRLSKSHVMKVAHRAT